jgi:molybdopterin molybdotransferase
MLAALVGAAGGEPWILPTAADNAKALDSALAKAAKADLLLISGGVSAGKFDLVEPALAKAAASFFFTGVRIQPGKPLVFGELPKLPDETRSKKPASRRAKTPSAKARTLPFFGLPGNPVSSAVTFLLFAAPVLASLAGGLEPHPRFALAKLTSTEKTPKASITRFLPAKCTFGSAGNLPEVALVTWQGSGDLAAMALANCFVVFPENAEPFEPGAVVKILLY